MVSRSLTADPGQEPRVGELLKRTEQRIQSRRAIPTVSLLMIPLIYYHINSFQGVSSVGKP